MKEKKENSGKKKPEFPYSKHPKKPKITLYIVTN